MGLRAGRTAGVGVATVVLVLAPVSAAAQQRGSSQQVRIGAHVKAFCRLGRTHHGMFLKGRTDDGRHIDRRLGGHGHFNVICNTPYALHFHRWTHHHGPPGHHDHLGRGPRDMRVDNVNDLNVLLHYASNTAVLETPCLVAATPAAISACLDTALPGETLFPPSRTLVRLAVAAQPPPRVRVTEVVFYPEPGLIAMADDEFDEDDFGRDDYVALSVTGRY